MSNSQIQIPQIIFFLPCEWFIVIPRHSKRGQSSRVKLKRVPLSCYIITTPWTTGCLLVQRVRYWSPSRRANWWRARVWGSRSLAQCTGSRQSVGSDVCHWMWTPASFQLCWEVTVMNQELHQDRKELLELLDDCFPIHTYNIITIDVPQWWSCGGSAEMLKNSFTLKDQKIQYGKVL